MENRDENKNEKASPNGNPPLSRQEVDSTYQRYLDCECRPPKSPPKPPESTVVGKQVFSENSVPPKRGNQRKRGDPSYGIEQYGAEQSSPPGKTQEEEGQCRKQENQSDGD